MAIVSSEVTARVFHITISPHLLIHNPNVLLIYKYLLGILFLSNFLEEGTVRPKTQCKLI